MQELLHKHGINMRYLGKILEHLKPVSKEAFDELQPHLKGDFKHLRSIVEREIIVRCAKHVFKSYMREQLSFSSLHISHCVTHLLNLLLCPQPFLHTLNNGSAKFQDETIQTQFPICPDSAQSHSPLEQKVDDKPKASNSNPQQNELSKKQKKKQAQKEKKQGESKEGGSNANDTEKTMSDILF